MKDKKPINAALAILVFVVGATKFFDLALFARVPLAELIAFISALFLLRNQPAKILRRLYPILGILTLWIVGIILSDLTNYFRFETFIRAFMRPVFVLMWSLFFVGVISRDYRALLFFPAGLFIASLQNYYLPRSFNAEFLEGDGYASIAFGISHVIRMGALFISTILFLTIRSISWLPFAVGGIALAGVGAPRSAAAILFVCSAAIFYIWWSTKGDRRRFIRFTKAKVIGIMLGGLALGIALFYVYLYTAEEGLLGEIQYQKLKAQQNTVFGITPMGLILGGRTQVFAALLGIMDKPVLGHGSWTGVNLFEYYQEAVLMVGTSSEEINQLNSSFSFGAAGHSILFQGWLENGIFSAVAILLLGFIVFRQLGFVLQTNVGVNPLLIYLAIEFAWAFLFSPFSINARMTIGLFLAFYMVGFFERPFTMERSYRIHNLRH